MEPKWNDAANQPAEKLARQMIEMVTRSGFATVVDTGSDGENTVACGGAWRAAKCRGRAYSSRASLSFLRIPRALNFLVSSVHHLLFLTGGWRRS
jgi:hypothetical protein